jgi:hypothetical protein
MRILIVTAISLSFIAATLLVGVTLFLVDARSKLDATKSELGAALSRGAQLSTQLLTAEQQLLDKIAENESLTIELQSTTQQLTIRTSENTTLETSLQAIRGQLTSEIAENDTLMAENTTLTSKLESTTEQLMRLTEDNQALFAEVGQLNEVRDERDALVAQLDTLNSQLSDLQGEITTLELRRAPLIVEPYTGGFACTGSMEPKITCLDTATWLSNFEPESVVVGAVISFTPTAECRMSVGPIGHRVMAIKMVSGIYYYWPKGDASSEFDNCWIPDTNVNGYIIELHKNTNPENAPLRDKVNSAKAALDAAQQAYERMERVYKEKRVEYCGSLESGCTLAEPYFSELKVMYDEFVSFSEAYLEANDTWKQAVDDAIAKL